ncbi:MAG: acetolactate synthase large subunit, partial [Pirellula sp.]
PGPVLIDMPKDVQLDSCEVDWDVPMNLPGYSPTKHPNAAPEQIRQIAAAVRHSKRPIIYCGGGIVTAEASEELRKFAEKTGIPVTMTVMGLGVYPADGPL